MNKRILVTGKNGQLGLSLQKLTDDYPQYDFTFTNRNQLDLSSEESIEQFFSQQEISFDVIINAAAYTAVDKAESEPELADQINHFAVEKLAEIAKLNGIFLLHISTDYVFDGQNYRPYLENDTTNPQNIYGLTKYKGEKAMLAKNCQGAIIRTSWVYSEFGSNFVKTMLKLGQEKNSLNVIFDQIGTPTYATDLARTCLTLLSSDWQKSSIEIFHYSNEGVCSWYDFAKTIFEIANINCQVYPIETKDYPTQAKRPHYSVMSKRKIKKELNLEIPYWKNSLKDCLKNLSSHNK